MRLLLLAIISLALPIYAMEQDFSNRTFVPGPLISYMLKSELEKDHKDILELMINQASHPQRALGLDEYENEGVQRLVEIYEQITAQSKASTKKESRLSFLAKMRKPIEILGLKSNESTKLLQNDLHAQFIKLCKELVAYAYQHNHISVI